MKRCNVLFGVFKKKREKQDEQRYKHKNKTHTHAHTQCEGRLEHEEGRMEDEEEVGNLRSDLSGY